MKTSSFRYDWVKRRQHKLESSAEALIEVFTFQRILLQRVPGLVTVRWSCLKYHTVTICSVTAAGRCCSFARNLPLKPSFRYGVALYLALRLGQQGSQAKPAGITWQQRGQGASALLPEQREEVELLPRCLQLLRAGAAKGRSQTAGRGQLLTACCCCTTSPLLSARVASKHLDDYVFFRRG